MELVGMVEIHNMADHDDIHIFIVWLVPISSNRGRSEWGIGQYPAPVLPGLSISPLRWDKTHLAPSIPIRPYLVTSSIPNNLDRDNPL